MIHLLLGVLFGISAFPVFSFCTLNTETSNFHFNHVPVKIGFVVQIMYFVLNSGVLLKSPVRTFHQKIIIYLPKTWTSLDIRLQP